MNGIRITIDWKRCMGAGECVASAPYTFSLDENDKAVAKVPPGDNPQALEQAMRGCPNFAIRISRD